jgi:glycosyltransferase involved in cell wall biosynthesis
MRVHCFHSGNLQVPVANAVQTMHVCEAFAREGAQVVLFYPRYLWGNALAASECHAYYGVDNRFRLRGLAAPFSATLMTLPAYLPAAKLVAYAWESLRDALAPPSRRSDVVYTRCATAAAAMPFLGRLRGRSRPLVVFEAHEFPRDQARARTLRHVDAIVAITRATADELHARLGFPSERLLVAPDGVPDAWLEPIARDEARRRLGLRPEQPLAVYTGRLHPDTISMLFDAAERLRDRADLVLVGAPQGKPSGQQEELAALRERARARGLGITLVGPVRADDARLYQSAADVLVAPYSGALRWARYTSPLKIFEYMAAERPMVVSDLPVLHEVLEHDRSAWFVPAANGAALGDGVVALLDRPEVAARIASQARAEAPRYTWTSRARAILAFIERLRARR